MFKARRGALWLGATLAAGLLRPAAAAGGLPNAVAEVEHDLAAGKPRAAEIALRNAVREAPQDAGLRVRLARVELGLGDPISAEREARAARERGSKPADYLPVLAEALLAQGKFAEVLDSVRPGGRSPVLESRLRLEVGLAFAGLRDGAKAEAMLRDAVRLDPAATPPKLALARLLAPTRPDEAEKLIGVVLAVEPRSAEALRIAGELRRAKGDTAAARRLFDEALASDPHNLAARLSRAGLEIAGREFRAADADLDPVLKAKPENFFAGYLRGLERAEQQNYAAADPILARLEPAFADFPVGYYVEGAVKLVLGQDAQAEAILGKYLARVPDDGRATRLIAVAALRQHAPPRAVGYLAGFLDKSPPDPASLSLLGDAYMAEGRPALGMQQYQKAAELKPTDAELATRVAAAEIGAGWVEQGIAGLYRLAGSAGGAAVAGPVLVLAELHAGHAGKAAQEASALVGRDPENPFYQTLLGMTRAAQRDYPGAEAAYRSALQRYPGFAPAVERLADLYLATGRAADAEKIYRDRLAAMPADVQALLGLAALAIGQQNWAAAEQAIGRARSAAPEDPIPGLAQIRLDLLRGDWADAETVALALSLQFPTNLAVLDALGRAQLARNDLGAAVSTLGRAWRMANSPQSLQAYLTALETAKKFGEARKVVEEALSRDPASAALKTEMIRLTVRLEGVDAAIEKAEGYAKADPGNDAFALVSAEIYGKAGRSAEALAVLERAAAARPAGDALTIALARLYTRTGQFAKAEATLKSRLRAAPSSAAVGSALGALYLATARPALARKADQEVLAQVPGDPTALLGLADVAIAEQNWAAARAALLQAQQAAPDNPEPGRRLVAFYASRGEWKSAVAAAAALSLRFSDNVDVLDAQARAQLGAGDVTAAIASYRRAHALAPNSSAILSRYLSALDRARSYAEARRVLIAALERDPDNATLKAGLIQVAAKAGGLEAGLETARGFAEKDPGNSLYDRVSAELEEAAGKEKAAAARLERDLTTSPGDDELRLALARLYAQSGDATKAAALLEDRLNTDPDAYRVRAALASLYLEAGEGAAASAQYRRLLAQRPTDPVALNNLAWLVERAGNLAEARALAERAVAAAPGAAPAEDTLGWILLSQGETGRALIYLQAAGRDARGDPAIAYHLAVVLDRIGRAGDARARLETLLGSDRHFAERPDAERLLCQLKPG